jgi:poly-gamma-glutamate system protein
MIAGKKKRSDLDPEKKSANTIYILFGISFICFLLTRMIPEKSNSRLILEMRQASNLMARALVALVDCRSEEVSGREPAPSELTARDSVLGLEMSSITTSLGSLPSKKTSADPNFAGLMVYLLNEAGVQPHDNIVVGASGSFPALLIATLAAARIMEVRPIWICSLGASQWGANDPDFHWLRMWACLKKEKIFSVDPVAVSLGGEGDTGGGMEAEGRDLLKKAAEMSGLPFIYEPILKENVARRMQLYEQASAGKDIRVFVNIGGGIANIGTDSEILNLRPGLVIPDHIPSPEKRGVLFEMADRGIKIIHLLYMKGLSSRYGIAWNPDVLPRPGESELYELAGKKSWMFFWVGIFYLTVTFLMMVRMVVIRRQYWMGS